MYGNLLIVEHYNPGGDLRDKHQGGKEAYDLIIRDLKFSKENLNEITSNTIASTEYSAGAYSAESGSSSNLGITRFEIG